MTRGEKAVNLGAVVVPFVATLGAVVLLWNSWVRPADLAIAAVMYLITAVGITVGFHRLLTHRSFQTSKPIEYLFAVLGSLAVQGPVIAWVADHRKHHAHTDEEGDPHSPHVGHDGGVRGVLAGPWHAHTGWLMSTQGRANWKRYAVDPYDDRGMRMISRHFVLVLVLAWYCRRWPATWSAVPSPVPRPGFSGTAWCGSSSSITSPGASIPCATSSVAGASIPTIARPTPFGWRCPPWARPGTTITMPSPAPPYTG
jgi:fatty acid desaturase